MLGLPKPLTNQQCSLKNIHLYIHTQPYSVKHPPKNAFALANTVLTFKMALFKQHSHQNME